LYQNEKNGGVEIKETKDSQGFGLEIQIKKKPGKCQTTYEYQPHSGVLVEKKEETRTLGYQLKTLGMKEGGSGRSN